ncbi:hypothetical protein [Aureimonas pseudogalii]|uniref:Uncharacterized protein n=1 Tax=Aureimonas pseudogalii TaxID=1744844 RepID=A0A7W6H5T1_9HYPH|nr:hypothetical protein [Aureimonas pseudogalii]MBB3999095.1 hypothetical protein [Aureimonas pseudogalii]
MPYVLLTCGRSWPGGLESGRFNWLALPATNQELESHVDYAVKVDAQEAADLKEWGDDGPRCSPCGIDAYVAVAEAEWETMENLRCLASVAHRSSVLHLEDLSSAKALVEELTSLGAVMSDRARRSGQ